MEAKQYKQTKKYLHCTPLKHTAVVGALSSKAKEGRLERLSEETVGYTVSHCSSAVRMCQVVLEVYASNYGEEDYKQRLALVREHLVKGGLAQLWASPERQEALIKEQVLADQKLYNIIVKADKDSYVMVRLGEICGGDGDDYAYQIRLSLRVKVRGMIKAIGRWIEYDRAFFDSMKEWQQHAFIKLYPRGQFTCGRYKQIEETKVEVKPRYRPKAPAPKIEIIGNQSTLF